MAITPKAPGQISAPNTLTGEAVGNVAAPNTLTGEAVGNVATPNTLTGEAVGVVAAPNTLTGEAVGNVATPNTLTGEAVGSVSAPNTLTANAAGSVSAPNTLTGEAVGSVSAPNTLVGVTPAAFPRTLTPLVDMNFAAKSYTQSGTPVAFDDLFTYSRASSATFTNRRAKATGGYDYFLDTDYVGDVTNLVTYSEQFDNAFWFKPNTAVTTNSIIAPDGTTTAEKVTKTGLTGNDRISKKILGLPAATYTLNCYVKNFDVPSGGKTNLTFRNDSVSGSIIARAEFVWSGNIISSGNINSGVGDLSFRDAGGGWWLISLTGLFSATDLGVNIDINRGTGSTLGNSIYLWGAQLTESAKVLPYVKTLDAPVTQTFTETLRTEYDAATGENLGALIEGGSTNLAFWSEDFSNAAWTKSNAIVTPNSIIAPDGTISGDLVSLSTFTAQIKRVITVVPLTKYTLSFYVKKGTTTDLKYSVYDFTNLADIISPTSYFSEIGTDWTRVSVTFTIPVGCVSAAIYPVRDSAVTGTAYFWGAQLEALPFASSYIRTEGAAVSRSGDNLSLPSAGNFNASEYSVNVEFKISNIVRTRSNSAYLYSINDGTNANRIINLISSEKNRILNSVGVDFSNPSLLVNGTTYKSTSTFISDTVTGYEDDAFFGSRSPYPTVSPLTTINIGASISSSFLIFGHISKFATYDKALTAQEITLL